MQSSDTSTIIAQSTPSGNGALCLIRLSGDQAFSITEKMCVLKSKEKIPQLASHTIHYASIINSKKQAIDTVMLSVLKAPRTFTGEDTIEITCHNNQFVIEQIVQEAQNHGARLALPGEFTKRAVLHGKLDIVQAESIHELIQAQSAIGLRNALAQLEGSLSQKIRSIEKNLMKALALANASFEFLDEEDIEFKDQIKDIIQNIEKEIAPLNVGDTQQRHIREGLRIALLGTVNAGKSSLFNELVGSNRAIVHAQAGTTRDVVEVGLYAHGTYITYIDTAGIRTTHDEIEKEGINRSFQEALKADIILLIFDQSRTLTNEEITIYRDVVEKYEDKIIMVANKSDLRSAPKDSRLSESCAYVSVYMPETIVHLKDILNKKMNILTRNSSSPYILNKRHLRIIRQLAHIVETLMHELSLEKSAYEILAYHIHEALSLIAELNGKNITDNAMDIIFKEFCIGK